MSSGVLFTSVLLTNKQTVALSRDGRVFVIKDAIVGRPRPFFENENFTRFSILNSDEGHAIGLFMPIPRQVFQTFAMSPKHDLSSDVLQMIALSAQVPSRTGRQIDRSSPLHRMLGHWTPDPK